MAEIRRLQTFLDFVRLGTIAAVAAEARYSSSAVSQQLERLSVELGAPLLEADGRGLRLTPEGELLAELGPRLLDDWEELRARLAARRDELVGAVAVAAFQTGCLALFPPLIERLREDAPGIELGCVQAEPERSIPALRAREIDIAIIERYPRHRGAPLPELRETPLGDDAMLVAAPASWGAAGELARLADRPWVLEAQGSPARAWAESLCHEAGFAPRIAHETSDVVVQCALGASGAAAALIPALTPEALRGGAHCVPLAPVRTRAILAVTRRSAAERPAVRAVLAALAADAGARTDA
ncbi:LysR family transcriptional regulator [Leucobacter allii]|uniref:LysR family transcriptional regulator n=1 Tax=Leucobacter allii TaxID=2932247 RepID=A0ABY4FL31_9MICO|nr:LysR family transcriptional regulator [Leucobacter allii]UOQ56982.1 LysR family transcriptional regulator [Leucobacter allii]